MQDRFKFRIWKVSENRMVVGVTYLNPFILDEKINPDEAKNNILMQCTGLKDKNGKLIYEGDIVKTKYTTPSGVDMEKICKVNFDRCAYWINNGYSAFYLDNENCIYEIIGNIYENPELLEE